MLTSLTEATPTVSQQLADQYQLYQQLPDGHVQVYKLPAGIVPILVPASADDLKQDSSSLQQLQIPLQAQITSVVPNNTSSIPAMNCTLINRSNAAEKSEGSNVVQPLKSAVSTCNNPKEEPNPNQQTQPTTSTSVVFGQKSSTHRVDSQIENLPQNTISESVMCHVVEHQSWTWLAGRM